MWGRAFGGRRWEGDYTPLIELKDISNVPQEVRFVVTIPVAYATAASYDEAAKERLSQRTGKDLREFAYDGTWRKPL